MSIVFYRGQSRRAGIIADAVSAGLKVHRLSMEVIAEAEYERPDADIAVFYGLAGNLKQAQRDYVAAGLKAVFIDLGYWGRWDGGKVFGFHRVVVNGLHATNYFQRVKHGPKRFRRFGIEPKPFRRAGTDVLLCGMSAKASWVYGFDAQQWEASAVDTLRAATMREIKYRPKPSWPDAEKIDGTIWAHSKAISIQTALESAWACVTHHGNSALDALIAGVPVFCNDGLASVLACRDLAQIESPAYPDESARDQLLYDAAWTQWKVDEIAAGKMWSYLRNEGLI